MLKAEKDRLQSIISDTITLLCRNSITKFQKDFIVAGLIGITVDSEDLVLVSINEAIKNPNAPQTPEASASEDDMSDSVSHDNGTPGRKRKRKRKKRADGESTPKQARPQNDYDKQPTSFANQLNVPAHQFESNMDNSLSADGPSNDSSMFTLQEMKQDQESDDDDLIEIIKEEPGRYNHQEHIVSIQSLHDNNQHGMPMMGGVPGRGPGMPPGGMPQMPMPGAQMGDLNEQVELMPGSGVYIKRATFNQLQFIDKGSKLVRKLVREIFPDVHLLASSSCMGKGETSAGLDRHKVEVIKGYTRQVIPHVTDAKIHQTINETCSQLRFHLRKKKNGTIL